MGKYRRLHGKALTVVVVGTITATRTVPWAVAAWDHDVGTGARAGFHFVVYAVLLAAAAVTFLVWLREVRRNVARAGWPAADRWPPKRVVDDVWRASHPERRTSGLVTAWWVSLFVAGLLTGVGLAWERGPVGALVVTFAAAAGATAIFLTLFVVRRISLMQEDAGLARAKA
ncbi:DUF4328 domain-containing protein [Lentzea tibetensis]|uniref:DUF4328 domain-containing protein n=1 Tax=Lentzea tibetensis TaxID=2591470 RepID=A0A563EHW5_9PSEU|nr:DUF4328 domain-containing protein [Lentzea tibetensis]TWP46261.1 DUF4328 domain-containing protein [Lentzea tibetensis]